jgi:tetratricopeptide (TPR) repeat protein
MEDKKVKRNFARKAPHALFIVVAALFFTSCSSLFLRHGQTVDSAQQGENPPGVTVPKEQYDELARKYQELLNQSKQQIAKAEAAAPKAETPVAAQVNKEELQAKPETATSTAIDPSELVNHIDKAIPDTANVDSVDALKPEAKETKMAGPAVPTSMGVQHVNSTDDIDEQISRLREVQELIRVNKFEQALTLLKDLENSKEKQIVVRAKIMLGDLLFNQGEYDLASQVYDEIVKKYAFSGYVLKALGKLVACSEKLKQPEKQAKYYSLLHDFFEAS